MVATHLTARQVQDLLDVDASTVYRMAGDGRLPAVRVGSQWRFPADAIDAMLVPSRPSMVVPGGTPPDGAASSRQRTGPVLPAALVIATLEALAPALGVSMVVTDLGGRPLIPIVNPAPAIRSRMDDAGFTEACAAEWGSFAADLELAPRLKPGRFGFLCAHSLVRHGTSLIAMVLAGGIDPGDGAPDLFQLDAGRRATVLETLPRTAVLLSRLASIPVAEPILNV